ncbi:MAG TPA: hypothetical protein VGM23_00040 [Armatimonadota bacterium]|jgi:hypothetical protein
MAQAEVQPVSRPEGADSPLWIIGLLGALVLIGIADVVINQKFSGFHNQWTTLLGVVVTLAIFSVLYKDNPVFRFVEHIFIGLATGIGIVYFWVKFAEPEWFVPMMPNSLVKGGGGLWWFFLALPLGLLFFSVYFPKLAWMNRFALGVVMGWVAGAALQMFMGLLGPQLVASFRPPVSIYPPPTGVADVNNIPYGHLWWHPWTALSLVVMICVLAYFFFSVEHRSNWMRHPAVAGRYLLMITLGAIFGTTVMGRFSLLIQRLDFMIKAVETWWHLIVR